MRGRAAAGKKVKTSEKYIALIVLVFSILLYGNIVQNSYSIDDTYVTQDNPRVMKGFAGIPGILTGRYADEEGNSFGYRPVAMLSFAIEQELWGQNPHMGHLINILLYATILLLLFQVLRKIFRNAHFLFLLAVVLLFGAHPIHTEVAASLKNRETLFSFLFSLASLWYFLKWFDTKRALYAIPGGMLFLLAFLSKQDAITFVAIIPLALLFHSPDPFHLPRWEGISIGPSSKRILISLAILGIAGILAYKLPNLYLPAEVKTVYKYENPQFVNDPLYETLPMGFYTLFFYLGKLVWPHPLGFYYGYKMIPEVRWLMPEVILSMVFHIGIMVFALLKLRQKHILSFAILYYLATISVFSNFIIKIPGIVGERLAFFPSLGFCIVLAWTLFRLLKMDIRAVHFQKRKVIQLSVMLLVIIIPYSIKTISRNTQWKDYITLYSHDIEYLENSAKANNTYASQLMKEAFNNDKRNPAPEIQQKYLGLAVKHLHKTVEIDPSFKSAWNNLGFITYQYLGKQEEGIGYMEKAVQIDPGYEDALFNLGFACKQMKQYGKAIHYLEIAVQINAANTIYLHELADAYFQQGDRETALKLYTKSLMLNPISDHPNIRMGEIYWLTGDTLQAIENWERAFSINPGNLDVCLNLMEYYTARGDSKAGFYSRKADELRRTQQ